MRWIMSTDGACLRNSGPAGIGVWAVDKDGAPVCELSEFIGPGTNNYAEYVAIKRGMQEAIRAGVTDLTVQCDSQVVVNQIHGTNATRCPHLGAERLAILAMMAEFDLFSIEFIYDDDNEIADRLAKQAARRGRNR